jgi:hypothetical protein
VHERNPSETEGEIVLPHRVARVGFREAVGNDEAIVTGFQRAGKVALGTLGELVKIVEESVGKLTNRPDKVELEFNAKLSGDCNLWIVSGEGAAEFKVKLAWNKGA